MVADDGIAARAILRANEAVREDPTRDWVTEYLRALLQS